jgi:crotonobetainyl-CoA hydratase
MADLEFCKTETENNLLIITINRPEKMNALHPPASKELSKVFDDFLADDKLWVAIITGAGDKAFSAGNDLRYQAEGGDMFMPDSGFAGLTARAHMTKPVIAAVNGVAMGGGFEIALACDIILASDNARFALPEPKVGLAALAGGLHRLPRQIPLKQAMGMILTGRHVGAEEGAEIGFVTKVFPQASLMQEARKWAQMILECSPVSIRTSKAVISKSLENGGVFNAMDAKYEEIGDLMRSEDAKEGPLAFSQKRKPEWKGR